MGRKEAIRKAIERAGFSVSRLEAPASPRRPVGQLKTFLEDLRSRGFHPKHVVDVGANRGNWSRIAYEVWPSASFTLIEPQLEMKPYLDGFTNGRAARWIQAGAGDKPGELTLTVTPDPVSSTFALNEEEAQAAGLTKRRTVSVVTLDSLLGPDDTIPEIVKIDVEEFEIPVLRGAGRYFGATEVFIIESSLFKWHSSTTTLTDLMAFMGERGYALYDFPGFMRRPLDGALGLVDVAFALEYGTLRANSGWA